MNRISAIFKKPKELNRLCSDISKSDCVVKIYKNAFDIKPYTVAGVALLFSLYEDTLIGYKYEDNQGDKIKYNLFSNLDLVDKYNDLLAFYESKQSLAKIFIDFPTEKLNSISNNLKQALDLLYVDSLTKIRSKKSREAFKANEKELIDLGQKNTAAYFIKKMEEDNYQIFKKSICANLTSNIEVVRQRMLSPEHAPNLSTENVAVIKYRIARFEQNTVCKK